MTTTPKVYLTKRPAKLPSGKRVHYWTLKYFTRQGRARWKSLGRVGKVSRKEAEAAKRQMIVDLSTGKAREGKPSRMATSSAACCDRQSCCTPATPWPVAQCRLPTSSTSRTGRLTML